MHSRGPALSCVDPPVHSGIECFLLPDKLDGSYKVGELVELSFVPRAYK